MELLIGYVLFAITTAITAAIVLMRPVLKGLKEEEPLNVIIEYSFLSYLVFFIIAVLAAPLLFSACIFPTQNQKFKDSLNKSIRS